MLFKSVLNGCFLEILSVYYVAMSADRPIFRLANFVDSGSTYQAIFGDGFAERGRLIDQLRRRQGFAEKHNGPWVDAQLVQARRERRDPLIDVLAVTENGEALNSYSTYTVFKYNCEPSLTEADMVNASRARREFVMFVTGQRDTALIWHAAWDTQVSEVLKSGYGDINIEDYPLNGGSSEIRVAHVKGGVMGRGKFFQKGIIYGQMGFWANRDLCMGEHGSHINIQMVHLDKTRLLPIDTYISPLDYEEVINRGGTPIEFKRGNVVRVVPEKTGGDFIVGAASATADFPHPVVLRYTTMRPWKGEVPGSR